MKYLAFLFIIAFTISCKKEDDSNCKTCTAITESDERIKCGFANNGWEQLSTQSLGKLCDEQINTAIAAFTNSQQAVSTDCGAAYTIRTKVDCK